MRVLKPSGRRRRLASSSGPLKSKVVGPHLKNGVFSKCSFINTAQVARTHDRVPDLCRIKNSKPERAIFYNLTFARYNLIYFKIYSI